MSIKTYLVADAKFFDSAAAKEQNLTVEEYNNMIINNINNTVKDDDCIIFNGVITINLTLKENKELLSKIKGKKYIIDYDFQSIIYSIADWKEMGFTKVFNTPGAQKNIINGRESYVILGIDKKEILGDLKGKDHYIAVPESIYSTGELYKDKILNISIKNWNFEPIEIGERLPQMFDDQELFLTMRENIEE